MRPVQLTPSYPSDDKGKLQWLIERVTQLCNASQVDSPVDVASENESLYQPLDDGLTAIAALAPADGNIIVGNGTTWVVESDGTARASLGLTIGTHVQAWDALLDGISALAADPGADRVLAWDDSAGAPAWLEPKNGMEVSNTDLQMTANQRTGAIIWEIDGGGAPITTGIKGEIFIPFNCTITEATLLADQTGSIVVDIYKVAYASYPPASSICAAAKPTISASNKSTDATLSGWTTTVSAGDTLRFTVDSASTVTRTVVVLTVIKT